MMMIANTMMCAAIFFHIVTLLVIAYRVMMYSAERKTKKQYPANKPSIEIIDMYSLEKSPVSLKKAPISLSKTVEYHKGNEHNDRELHL